jgi:hypothetical protein
LGGELVVGFFFSSCCCVYYDAGLRRVKMVDALTLGTGGAGVVVRGIHALVLFFIF